VALVRNPRKTECGAKQFLAPLVVRAAPFALLQPPLHGIGGGGEKLIARTGRI